MEQLDRYESLCRQWQTAYTTWDIAAAAKRLGLSGYTEDTMTLRFYGEVYEIENHTGKLTRNGLPVREFNTVMCILHLFYYASEAPMLSHRFVPLRDIRSAAPFAPAFEAGTLSPAAKLFSGHGDALRAAGEALGFTPIPYGDVGFQASAFDCLPIQFLFFEGDEEFPARFQVLFDSFSTLFLHPETVIMLPVRGITLLGQRAGLPLSD